MPEKPASKSPPKPLTNVKKTRPGGTGTSSNSASTRNRPSGTGATRPPLPNAHDRIWKIMKM
ncbi:uncharacterized protein LOC108091764 [Drosophila ficusphila]|uniref:uncharacterized protein LOC108091764 n=1 Tax=Drosophila ficusphila TaxID=30025 RepID=UPI0007E74775|nr:uncharacterized protein LOC108091764 [Drosophila ficusphila]